MFSSIKPSVRYVGRYLYILRNFVIIRRWQSIDTIIIFDRFRGLITHAHYSTRSSRVSREKVGFAFIETEVSTTRVASRFLTICWGFQRSTVNLIPRIRGAIFIVRLRDVLSILPSLVQGRLNFNQFLFLYERRIILYVTCLWISLCIKFATSCPFYEWNSKKLELFFKCFCFVFIKRKLINIMYKEII